MEIIIIDKQVARENAEYLCNKILFSDMEYVEKIESELRHNDSIGIINFDTDMEAQKIYAAIENRKKLLTPNSVKENNVQNLQKVKTLIPNRDNTSLLSNRRGAISVGILISGILMTLIMMITILTAIY